MTILPIDVSALRKLAGLLGASYGDGFELQDELDWFPDPAPENWFYLSDPDGKPRGFLRFFPIVAGLYLAECYAEPTARNEHRATLLRHFLDRHSFPTGTRIRFDLRAGDPFERTLEQACDVVSRKTFKRYELRIEEGSPSQRRDIPTRGDAAIEQAQTVLATLKPYSTAELRALAESQTLHLLEVDSQVVAALHHQPVGRHGCEIVTFAVGESLRGRGYGKELLRRFIAWCQGRFDRVRLQVEDGNASANHLYAALGFQSDPMLNEHWLYIKL